MTDAKVIATTTGNWIGLLIIGVGVGWLVGMSTSPAVSIVITSLTGAAAAIVAVLSGLEDTNESKGEIVEAKFRQRPKRVHVGPLVALVVGIVMGTVFGLWCRSNGWLGTDLDVEINKWTKHGLSEQIVTEALFSAAFPATDSGVEPSRLWTNTEVGVLFSYYTGLTAVCASLLNLDGAELRRYALGTSSDSIRQIAESVEDPVTLKAVLEAICPSE